MWWQTALNRQKQQEIIDGNVGLNCFSIFGNECEKTTGNYCGKEVRAG